MGVSQWLDREREKDGSACRWMNGWVYLGMDGWAGVHEVDGWMVGVQGADGST